MAFFQTAIPWTQQIVRRLQAGEGPARIVDALVADGIERETAREHVALVVHAGAIMPNADLERAVAGLLEPPESRLIGSLVLGIFLTVAGVALAVLANGALAASAWSNAARGVAAFLLVGGAGLLLLATWKRLNHERHSM